MEKRPSTNFCGSNTECAISPRTTQTELRAIKLFANHLKANSQTVKVLCNPEATTCLSRNDFMVSIDEKLWFIEHTMLGFDSLVEDRMFISASNLEPPLRELVRTRGIRMLVMIKFTEPKVTANDLEQFLRAIESHLDRYDHGLVRTQLSYPLLDNQIDVQIFEPQNCDELQKLGNLHFGFTLNLSIELEHQFNLANMDSIKKKFSTQIKKQGNIQKTALIIDQTYKAKDDGTVFYGNSVFPKEFIKRKIQEIASKHTHEVSQVWLIDFNDEVSILCDWT